MGPGPLSEGGADGRVITHRNRERQAGRHQPFDLTCPKAGTASLPWRLRGPAHTCDGLPFRRDGAGRGPRVSQEEEIDVAELRQRSNDVRHPDARAVRLRPRECPLDDQDPHVSSLRTGALSRTFLPYLLNSPFLPVRP